MIIKSYILFSIFFVLSIIFSYYTIVSIFSFLGLLLILCSLLFLLNIELMSFLLLFVYMGGILIFFLFSSLMLNMQFNFKKYTTYTFSYFSFILVFLIILFKFFFLLLYYLINLITYFIYIFNYNYLPLCLNNNFNIFKLFKQEIFMLNSLDNYTIKRLDFFYYNKSGDHFDSFNLLCLYEHKWFLLFLIGFILFTVLLVVSSLCLKKNV